MSFDQMILWVMAIGVLIGAGDKITCKVWRKNTRI